MLSTTISNLVISSQMGQLDAVARRRIDAWRKAAGLTQAALAKRIGRNPVWISRYLDDAYDADLDTLKRMADALGRTLNDLLGPDQPTSDEGELIERFHALDDEAKDVALRMMLSDSVNSNWTSCLVFRSSRVWSDKPSQYCGIGYIGGDLLVLYPKTAGCRCGGGPAVAPLIIKHEMGHVLGFYHTDQRTDLMYPTGLPACDMDPSPREQFHAAIAYGQPIGSFDPK